MSSIVQRLVAKAHQLHCPIFTTLELTQLCNLSCRHCYNFDRESASTPKNLGDAMSTAEIFDVIVQLKEIGAMWLNLSGGEPLLHKDLLNIIEHAKNQHLFVRLKTNGLLLDKNNLIALQNSGLDAIDVSLYGIDDEAYRILCGRDGAQKVKAAILDAVELGFDVSTNIILTKTNLTQLDDMISWCEENKLRYQIAEEITARYDGTTSSKELAIDGKDLQTLLSGKHAHRFMYKNHDKALQCSCAKTVLGIGFDGSVYPCIGAPIYAGHVREKTLKELWSEAPVFQKIRGLVKDDFKSCTSCDYIETCSRSSGTAFVNTGEYTACDPKFLEFARLRAHSNYK